MISIHLLERSQCLGNSHHLITMARLGFHLKCNDKTSASASCSGNVHLLIYNLCLLEVIAELSHPVDPCHVGNICALNFWLRLSSHLDF